MFNFKPLSKCNCGYGEGFYHREANSVHEYNPYAPDELAVATLECERNPLAKFFGHIDGQRVVIWFYDHPDLNLTDKVISLYYKDFRYDRSKTFEAAAREVLKQFQQQELCL